MEDYKALLDVLKSQEDTLQFTEFSNETAYKIGTRLVEIASQGQKPITVDIHRNGQQLFHCALPNTTPDNDEWIKRKNRVVNRWNHSSYFMGISCKVKGVSLAERFLIDPREYADHGGAFPIIIKNVGVVGTITVSGLPQEEDHNLVVSVIKEFVNQ